MKYHYIRSSSFLHFLLASFVFLASLGLSSHSYGQDTLTVMQYNLLYYGANTDYCTYTNNSISQKDANLKIIVDHVQPDILGVNEIGAGKAITQRVLNNVLNVDDPERWARAAYTNRANSNITNMLYYDQQKFGLYDQKAIINIIRDINLYTLYYKDEALAQGADTTFLSCIVTHLKAGSSTSDKQTRAAETEAVMSYIENNDLRGNILFIGDLNIKSSYEESYKQLVSHPTEEIRFYDPIDKPGTWYNNSQMALYHTQSPRNTYHSCFSSGGMDDRFDFILGSASIMDGHLGLQYLADSYNTIGQDGKRFNLSLTDPVNESAPGEVIQALYDMSDHLPVSLRLVTTENTTDLPVLTSNTPKVQYTNPVQNTLHLQVSGVEESVEVSLFDLTGSRRGSYQLQPVGGQGNVSIDVSHLPSGIYLIQVTTAGMQPFSGKLIRL